MLKNWFTLVFLLLIVLILPAGLQGQEPEPPNTSPELGLPTDQIIIKFRDPVGAAGALAFDANQMMVRLSGAAGLPLSYYRPMAGEATVLKLPERLPLAEVEAASASLSALPEVEYAEPDRILQIIGRPASGPQATGVTPDDTRFGDQWHYGYTAGTDEGLNLIPAWGITTGSASTVVAVIDTGILSHADLSGRIVPGYDFISNVFVANDGTGRDADPSDPGDWVNSNDCGFFSPPSSSSWHGTHVAGTIGAATNNGVGGAGVNWQARILPVRVLGRCGGLTSDIIDGMSWAAGLAVPGVPANAHPARVLNLSLGGSSPCSPGQQDAIDNIVAAGATVVIAAGNNNADSSNFSPGNCDDVITVAANDRTGDKAWYSNYGDKVEVAAPGGETDVLSANGVLSTLNSGTTTPGTDIYAYYQGTSMAAPHVAGLVSLILGQNPGYTPAQVLARLQSTARPFPAGSSCLSKGCGSGIVDAYQALDGLVMNQEHVYLPVVNYTEEKVPQIYFSDTDYGVNEASGSAVIEVRLSEPANITVTVDYATGGGTATAGDDYLSNNGTLQFDPGQTSKTFSVTIVDDEIYEADETVGLVLTDPGQAELGVPADAILTVVNDDAQSDPIVNGDFEQGEIGWIQYSNHDWTLILEGDDILVPPRSGSWAAWLGGDDDELSLISQQVTVPAGAPYFTYWHWIASADVCGFDLAKVIVDGSDIVDVYDLCDTNNTDGWAKRVVELSSWSNQNISVQIRVETDGLLNSNLYVDDVSFEISADAPAVAPAFRPGDGQEAIMSRHDFSPPTSDIGPAGSEQPLLSR